MSTFEHDGETFWYDVHGSGRPLLALHGGLGLDHTYLRTVLDPLGSEMQVVYFDFRANGRSTGDGEGMSMAQLASDVEALCDHLGLVDVAVFGHSYGGFVALEHALTYPHRPSRLVLCDTDTRGPTDQSVADGLQRLGLDVAMLSVFEEPLDTLDRLLEAFDAVEPAYFPHSPPGTGRAGLTRTIPRPQGGAGGEAALVGWDVGDRLGEIDVPTLVLVGTDDFMFPTERARLMAEGVRNGQLTIFEASGHLPFVEEPAAFRERLLAFVR
jgi:proline iminopeptidase